MTAPSSNRRQALARVAVGAVAAGLLVLAGAGVAAADRPDGAGPPDGVPAGPPPRVPGPPSSLPPQVPPTVPTAPPNTVPPVTLPPVTVPPRPESGIVDGNLVAVGPPPVPTTSEVVDVDTPPVPSSTVPDAHPSSHASGHQKVTNPVALARVPFSSLRPAVSSPQRLPDPAARAVLVHAALHLDLW